MRRISVLSFAAALALTAPTSALALPFTGTLSIQYVSASLPAAQVAGSGTSVDGAGGAFTLAPGAFAGNASADTSDAAPFLVWLELANVASGAGSFSGGSGSMAVNGNLLHYFFQGIPGYEIPIPLANVGVGGTTPFAVVTVTGPASGSITGSTWTTGAISVVGQNETLNASGFDSRALDGTGAIRFVTPIDVALDLGTGLLDIAGYAQLDLVFTAAAPEPASLALLAVGLVTLVAVRRVRAA